MKKATCKVYEANIGEYGYYEYDLDWLKAVSGKKQIGIGDHLSINGDSYKVVELI